jgi:integrase/recombinase XerD
MNLDVLINRYRQQLEILNFSPQTWRTQASHLHQFQRFLAEIQITDAQAVTSAMLHDFQRWLFHEPTSKGTMRHVTSQNRNVSTIRSFFVFLHEEGIIAHNPAKSLEHAREPETLPRNVLTPQEARKIIERPDLGTHLGYRDRTILEVLYATGIRKAELMGLTLADVNLEEELLRVNGGKGSKDRVVPLTQIACSFLENYIKGIRPVMLAGRASDRLFISLRQQPISKNAVGGLVEKYARLAGVKKHVTCHLWRHSCATHLVKNRANLRHVQEIMGHRSLATTERYLHLTITDLKAAHRKFHPREMMQRGQKS